MKGYEERDEAKYINENEFTKLIKNNENILIKYKTENPNNLYNDKNPEKYNNFDINKVEHIDNDSIKMNNEIKCLSKYNNTYSFKSLNKSLDFSKNNKDEQEEFFLKNNYQLITKESKEYDSLLKNKNMSNKNSEILETNNENNLKNNDDYFQLNTNKNNNLDNNYSTFEKSKNEIKISSISIELDENANYFSLYQGLVFMLLSCIFKSLFSVFSKFAMNNIKNLSSYQLLTFRTYIMLFICFIVAYLWKIKIFSEEFIRADKVFLVFLRTIFAIISMSLVVYCFKHMYVSDVYSVYYIYPAFLIVFSIIYFKEKISKFDLLCLFACFFGVILVVQPDFIFDNSPNRKINRGGFVSPTISHTNLNTENSNENNPYNNLTLNSMINGSGKDAISSQKNLSFNNQYGEDFDNKGFFIILVIAAALIKAMEDFIIKDVGKHVHYLAFPFMYTVIGIIFFPIPMLYFDKVYAKFNIYDVFIIFCIAVFTFLYISFLALGFQTENAGRVSMINYFQVIFMYISDLFMFNKQLELFEFIGTLLIFGFNITNGLLKTLKRKKLLDTHNENNYKNDL